MSAPLVDFSYLFRFETVLEYRPQKPARISSSNGICNKNFIAMPLWQHSQDPRCKLE